MAIVTIEDSVTQLKIPKRQVLTDQVFDVLMAQLVDGKLVAGSPLKIDRLARGFEVSQTPVREALARLESTGLVERTALRGYTVAPMPTKKELSDLMDARLVLEPMNSFLACERSDDEFLAKLSEAVADFEDAPTGPTFRNFRQYWTADERFHLLIAEQADNRSLLSAYQALGGLAQRFRQFGGVGVTDAQTAVIEHTAILMAFKARDPEAARAAMAAHIVAVKERALSDIVE